MADPVAADPKESRPAKARPIMIVGICRRSGTNYLASVLLCHRDCAAPAPPVAEDHLLRDAQLLARYARNTARRWPRRWGDREEAQTALERSLGAGVLEFLKSRTDGLRTVARTPFTDNLELAARFYSDADVVLLVRDGRSVTESLVHAWNWSFDEAVREWRAGARAIIAARQRDTTVAPDRRFLVVRYEDLLGRFDTTIERILAFTGLDRGGFDDAKAAELPILGSSYIRDGNGRLTWAPVRRTEDFDPSARFAGWSPARHERFNWLAGAEQQALGYAIERFDRARPRVVAHQLALDASWLATGWARGRARRLRNEARAQLADHRWQRDRQR
jgi:Sulfotransferase family